MTDTKLQQYFCSTDNNCSTPLQCDTTKKIYNKKKEDYMCGLIYFKQSLTQFMKLVVESPTLSA